MYHVFFNRRPTRPRLPRALYEQLAALPLNTEVNVHTTNETHYNALFLGFEPRTNSVSLLVDRFYKDGGAPLRSMRPRSPQSISLFPCGRLHPLIRMTRKNNQERKHSRLTPTNAAGAYFFGGAVFSLTSALVYTFSSRITYTFTNRQWMLGGTDLGFETISLVV
ncbi:hypothetical protein [Geobacillus sp. JS12]|uniref:hypothetical protein n=1 Tax=Geobacillus sp. JS12 TaxID=1813182 RepID=UPI000A4EFABE|nr:hypothetical protein [Geobacillus sp. JS12]